MDSNVIDSDLVTKHHFHFHDVNKIHKAWKVLCGDVGTDITFLDSVDIIDNSLPKIFKKIDFWGSRIRRFMNCPDPDVLIILVDGEKELGSIDQALRILCNLWRVKNGFIPLHSCGIIHKGDLFFLAVRQDLGKVQ